MAAKEYTIPLRGEAIAVEVNRGYTSMYLFKDIFVDFYDSPRDESYAQSFRYVTREDLKKALAGEVETITAYHYSGTSDDEYDVGPGDEDGDTSEGVAFHIGCKDFDNEALTVIRKWAGSPDRRIKFWENVVRRLGVARVTASGLNRIPNPEDRAAIREVLKSFKKAKRAAA